MAMSRLVPLLEFNQRWVNAVETSKDFSGKPAPSGTSVWPRNQQGRKRKTVDTALERSRVARCSIFAPHQRSGKERQQYEHDRCRAGT